MWYVTREGNRGRDEGKGRVMKDVELEVST